MAKLYFNKEDGLIATKRDLKGLKDIEIFEKGWENINDNYDSKSLVLWVKKTEEGLYKIEVSSPMNHLNEYLSKSGYSLAKEGNSNDIVEEYRYKIKRD